MRSPSHPRVLASAVALLVSVHASLFGSEPAAPAPFILDRFEVTGSHLRQPHRESSRPITRFDAEQLDLIGAASLGDALKYVPFIDASASSIGPSANGAADATGDAASADLRGLGEGNTLVLLDGRRLAPHGIAPGTPAIVFVNVNQIPAAAIARVEILRDSASAIYGSDAIGGVVNVILKSDYTSTETRARYASSRGGYDELSASIALGRSFNAGRTHLTLFASAYERDGLDASDRWFSADADKRPLVPAPFTSNSNYNARSSSAPFGRFSRINTTSPAGAITSSTSFFIQPNPSGSGVRVASGAGPTATFNHETTTQLVGDVSRQQIFTRIRHAVTPQLTAFAEASFARADAFTQAGETPVSGNTSLSGTDNVIVPASNHYNPYGARLNPTAPRAVLIRNYRPVEIGPRTFRDTHIATRLLAGLEGRFSETWHWDVAALRSESRAHNRQGNLISQSRLAAQLALNSPDAFNPFGGPHANSPGIIDRMRIEDWTRGTGRLSLLDVRATGELFTWRGGPIAAAIGAEFRREEFVERNGPFGLADDVIAVSGQVDIAARRNVTAGYAELAVPIVGAGNRLPALHALDVTAAIRREDFGRFSATKPHAAASLAPWPWMSFRASRGEGFRAPSVSELFQPARSRRNNGLIDTARVTTVNGATVVPEDAASGVSKLVITGGSPLLRPENSRSTNFGVTLAPPALRGLSFGIDVWRIEQSDRIDNPAPQDELNRDAELWRDTGAANPNVTRAPRTSADVAANLPGVLVAIDGVYQNLQHRLTEGSDFSFEFTQTHASLGRFTLRGEATRYRTIRDTFSDGTIRERVGQVSRPQWRGLSSLAWKKSAWSAGVLVRHVDGYKEDDSLDTAGQPFLISAWTTTNIFLAREFERGLLRGASLRLGAENIFDRDPPLSPDSGEGFDPALANPFGRLLYVDLRWRW